MTILEKIFLTILYSSLTATAVVLLVLLIKRAFQDRFTPRFHHILWILVLIRLLIPFAPESNLSLFNILPGYNQNLSFNILFAKPEESRHLPAGQPGTVNKMQPDSVDDAGQTGHKNLLRQNTLARTEKTSLKDKNVKTYHTSFGLLAYIWLAGVLSMALFVLLGALRFRKNAGYFNKVQSPSIISVLDNCRRKLKLSKQIQLFSGNSFKSPFIFGIGKPGIYLPKQILAKVDNQELSHILLHELGHYKRGDLICNLLSTAAVTLHWFNPIVWYAIKEMRNGIECACDSYVLESLGESESTHYGMTIIKLSGLISQSRRNKMLYAYFCDGKGQIERRITMINMFKRGSYKLTAIAIALFIALGTCTLTNANAQDDWNVVTKATEPGSIKEEQFSLDKSTKAFYDLDRAMDFIDFDFKVPDKLPANYEFDIISFDGEKDLVNLSFRLADTDKDGEAEENTDSDPISILVSKNDLVKYLKEKHSGTGEETAAPQIDFDEKSMELSGVTGTCLKIQKSWQQENEDMSKQQEVDKLRNVKIKKLLPSEQTDEYFIWQEDGIWYGIHYVSKSTYFDSDTTRSQQVSKDYMNVILASLKHIKDIKNISYVSKDADRFLQIYDNKDLKTAEKLLGFNPKFPLSLPGGFIPAFSNIYTVLNEEDHEVTEIDTNFRLEDEESPQELDLFQIKDTSEYDDIVQTGYVMSWDYTNTKPGQPVKQVKTEVTPIMIDGIKVLTYERDVINPNILEKGITTVQYYLWKQNDVSYEVSFIGDTGNQQEIVKALIAID